MPKPNKPLVIEWIPYDEGHDDKDCSSLFVNGKPMGCYQWRSLKSGKFVAYNGFNAPLGFDNKVEAQAFLIDNLNV